MPAARLAWECSPGAKLPEPSIEWLEGQGTAENPYRIDTSTQLLRLGRASILCERHVVLCADIDLDPKLTDGQVLSRAVIPTFAGVFDGNDHTILHLTIKGGSHLGLFGHLASGAEVRELGVVGVNIVGSGSPVGGLVGLNHKGTVIQCYGTGVVSGDSYVGGLVGCNYQHGTVTQCHSTGAVSGYGLVGGLVGYNYQGGTVTQCYSSDTVSGGWSVGGLVGGNSEGDSGYTEIANCYSTGAVNGKGQVGGLVGSNGNERGITHCYSTGTVSGSDSVGGLVGWNETTLSPIGIVVRSFWDTRASGCTTSAGGGTGLTKAQMQTAALFLNAGWDFVAETKNGTKDIWWINEGQEYPRLWWQYGLAFSPDPADGAIDVVQTTILQWRPGGRGLLHDVYFGEDEAAVAKATPASPGIYCGLQQAETVTYEPVNLVCGRTYYWRIDEVNQTDPGIVWKGEVWSFTTVDYPILSVVDDFESYTDNKGGLIFVTWVGGQDNDTGSWVDNLEVNGTFCETTLVHGGRQSMQMEYCNEF